jgi:tRNA pseudouridine13 synthase
VEQRLATVRDHGVPNYFGEQRFGRDGQNVVQALAMFAGRNLPRPQRSMALSAARSEIFNAVLGVRVASAEWNVPLEGDVWMLDGTHAIFGPEARSEAQTQRCAALDIHPTGPMWGAGELRSEARVRDIEAAAAVDNAALSSGLERARLDQERRALRLRALDLRHAWEGPTDLVVEFRLTSGAFATTVLRELCDWSQGTTSAG